MDSTEFPTNSHKDKDDSPLARPSKKNEESSEEETKEKVKEKVIKGEAVTRKKPLGKKFMEVFFGGTSKGVMDYVVFDVIVPAAKDMFADAVSQGIERMIYGEARSTPRNRRSGGRKSHVSYESRYSDPRRPARPSLSHRARATHDFDEIVLETRDDAVMVLQGLDNRIERYRIATVNDLYDLVGVTGTYVDEKWGWVDLRDADITRVRGGYLVDLPEPEYLEA